MKRRSEETQTLRASKAEPKIFATPQTPFPGARDGQNLISCRWSLPLPTDPVWWGSMHAISSYRSNRPSHTQTHTPTNIRQGRLQYTAPQLARSVNMYRSATWLKKMVDSGEDCSEPKRSCSDEQPLEWVWRVDRYDVTSPASQPQEVTRCQLHCGVEFPERHRLSRRHVHLTMTVIPTTQSAIDLSLQSADTVGWASGSASGPVKNGCWFVGGDDMSGAVHVLLLQLSSLPPMSSIILSSNKIQNGDILVQASPRPPGK